VNFRRILIIIVALLIAASLIMPAVAHATPPAVPQQDWSKHISLTPEGAHVIGNPKAKNRLVEYISYTCSTCALFVSEGSEPLKQNWVKNGSLAVEIRNRVRDRYDITAALVARCGGPDRFEEFHTALFAGYRPWMTRVYTHEAISKTMPPPKDRVAELANIAEMTGLLAWLEQRGIPAQQGRACLTDKAALDTVMAMTKRAIEQDKTNGTPAFILNGTLLEAFTWSALKPQLPAQTLPTPAN